jgi:hypothetical protein
MRKSSTDLKQRQKNRWIFYATNPVHENQFIGVIGKLKVMKLFIFHVVSWFYNTVLEYRTMDKVQKTQNLLGNFYVSLMNVFLTRCLRMIKNDCAKMAQLSSAVCRY